MGEVLIRAEAAEDATAVAALVREAFEREGEAQLIAQLHADGDVALGLVAVVDRVIVGHVLLSKMRGQYRVAGLGPLSVAPAYRRRGIGASLVREALARAGGQGYAAVFVLGNPAYYERFGFRRELARGVACAYAGPYLMAIGLAGPFPAGGKVEYAPAFAGLK